MQKESWTNFLLPLALIVGLALLLGLNVGEAVEEAGPANLLEPWLKSIVGYLTSVAEIAAAFVIGVAVVRAIIAYSAQLFARGSPKAEAAESIRLNLGRMLALGLEFTIASDILRTAVAPTRQDILTLGSIVLLRTLLNFFLEREIREGEQRRAE